MLALLGLGTIGVFTVLVMAKKLSAVAALILVPTVFGLLGGFGADLGEMMISGIGDTAPTAVMLAFALLYFLVMIECGLFEPFVRKILSVVGDDPVKIVMGTAVLIIVVGFDGDGSTAAFITITSMYPIYRRVGINPLIIAMLLGIISPILNWMPWGGPAARMAVSLKIDIADIVIPMLPTFFISLAGTLVIAFFLGRRERRKINKRKEQAALEGKDAEGAENAEGNEVSVHEPRKVMPTRNFWFNLVLTLVLIVSMAMELAPLPALVMAAFAIAVTVNFPKLREQEDRLKPHSGMVVNVITLILAAGAFTGILNETGMVDAMSDSIISSIPEDWGGAFAFVTALVSGPLLFILSNDSFYFGVIPVLADTAAAYGVPPEAIAHAALPGMFLHSLSPLIAPIYLVASLLRKDIGSLQRFAFPWAIAMTFLAIGGATVTGAIFAV